MRAPLPVLATLFLLGAPVVVEGQRPLVDASIGASAESARLGVGAIWQVRLGDRIRLGAGPRLTRFSGEAHSYRTHETRPPGLASRVDIAPEVWALNLMVSAELGLAGPFELGANLDLAGVAAGPSRMAGGERLVPARGSLFLYGDRDRGSLNSEYYLGVAVTPRLRIRAGLSHYVTGYRVADGPTRPRYLRFDSVPFLALRWGR